MEKEGEEWQNFRPCTKTEIRKNMFRHAFYLGSANGREISETVGLLDKNSIPGNRTFRGPYRKLKNTKKVVRGCLRYKYVL